MPRSYQVLAVWLASISLFANLPGAGSADLFLLAAAISHQTVTHTDPGVGTPALQPNQHFDLKGCSRCTYTAGETPTCDLGLTALRPAAGLCVCVAATDTQPELGDTCQLEVRSSRSLEDESGTKVVSKPLFAQGRRSEPSVRMIGRLSPLLHDNRWNESDMPALLLLTGSTFMGGRIPGAEGFTHINGLYVRLPGNDTIVNGRPVYILKNYGLPIYLWWGSTQDLTITDSIGRLPAWLSWLIGPKVDDRATAFAYLIAPYGLSPDTYRQNWYSLRASGSSDVGTIFVGDINATILNASSVFSATGDQSMLKPNPSPGSPIHRSPPLMFEMTGCGDCLVPSAWEETADTLMSLNGYYRLDGPAVLGNFDFDAGEPPQTSTPPTYTHLASGNKMWFVSPSESVNTTPSWSGWFIGALESTGTLSSYAYLVTGEPFIAAYPRDIPAVPGSTAMRYISVTPQTLASAIDVQHWFYTHNISLALHSKDVEYLGSITSRSAVMVQRELGPWASNGSMCNLNYEYFESSLRECKPLSAECGASASEVSPPTPTSDRVCMLNNPLVAPIGKYPVAYQMTGSQVFQGQPSINRIYRIQPIGGKNGAPIYSTADEELYMWFQPRYQKNVTAMWMIGTFDMLSARSPRDISAFAFIGVETKGPLHLFPLNTSGFFRGVRQQKWSAINLKAAKPVFANDFRALMLPPDATPSKKTKSYPFQITVAKSSAVSDTGSIDGVYTKSSLVSHQDIPIYIRLGSGWLDPNETVAITIAESTFLWFGQAQLARNRLPITARELCYSPGPLQGWFWGSLDMVGARDAVGYEVLLSPVTVPPTSIVPLHFFYAPAGVILYEQTTQGRGSLRLQAATDFSPNKVAGKGMMWDSCTGGVFDNGHPVLNNIGSFTIDGNHPMLVSATECVPVSDGDAEAETPTDLYGPFNSSLQKSDLAVNYFELQTGAKFDDGPLSTDLTVQLTELAASRTVGGQLKMSDDDVLMNSQDTSLPPYPLEPFPDTLILSGANYISTTTLTHEGLPAGLTLNGKYIRSSMMTLTSVGTNLRPSYETTTPSGVKLRLWWSPVAPLEEVSFNSPIVTSFAWIVGPASWAGSPVGFAVLPSPLGRPPDLEAQKWLTAQLVTESNSSVGRDPSTAVRVLMPDPTAAIRDSTVAGGSNQAPEPLPSVEMTGMLFHASKDFSLSESSTLGLPASTELNCVLTPTDALYGGQPLYLGTSNTGVFLWLYFVPNPPVSHWSLGLGSQVGVDNGMAYCDSPGGELPLDRACWFYKNGTSGSWDKDDLARLVRVTNKTTGLKSDHDHDHDHDQQEPTPTPSKIDARSENHFGLLIGFGSVATALICYGIFTKVRKGSWKGRARGVMIENPEYDNIVYPEPYGDRRNSLAGLDDEPLWCDGDDSRSKIVLSS